MYKGKKDIRLRIKIPQKYCYERVMNGGTFVEVRLPMKNVPESDYGWYSFMVAPEQVYYCDDVYNVIDDICAGSAIKLCRHYTDPDGIYHPIASTYVEVDPCDIIKYINETIGPIHYI